MKLPAYLGNPRLKRAGAPIPFTQEQVEEWLKCADDHIYFIKKYIMIVNVDRGFIPFELWPFQEEMINKFVNDRFTIAKMPRQVGKTTTAAAFILWCILFKENYSVAILANKMAQAREILSRIQRSYEALPKWLQQGVVEWNKGNIELENGSKVLAAATSSSAIRGTSQNLIYLDEFAFVPSHIQEEFFSSVYPTISSGKTTKVVITSTPNGLNMFYKIWTDSERGHNDYSRVSVHWSDVPGRDDKWAEQQIRNTSPDQFRVEFGCEFLGSSATLIDPNKLASLVYETPIESSPSFKMYKRPTPGHQYVMVVDVSHGVGLDYSAFIVFDVSQMPYEVVATFRDNKVPVLAYPKYIIEAAMNYNRAGILVEVNDAGQQIVDVLHHDLEYDGILTTAQAKKRIVLSGGFSGAAKTRQGVRTDKVVKAIGCANLKTMVEQDRLIVNDYQLIQEMSRFSLDGRSYEAEEGNDDLVMCCVLFSWLTAQTYFKEMTNVDFRRGIYEDSSRMIEEELTPFGFIETGMDEEPDLPNEQTVTLDGYFPGYNG
jgi:hypothetical protein